MDTPSSQTELRALVVDDNIEQATTLGYLMQLLGCRSATAFRATDALQVASAFVPNLMIVDLELGDDDGCAVVAAVRARLGRAEVYTVCLTGRGDLEDEVRCIEAGFDCFVTKPMALETLDLLLNEARGRADHSSSPPPPGR
jgi:DNA-binding response OmpR family regulator